MKTKKIIRPLGAVDRILLVVSGRNRSLCSRLDPSGAESELSQRGMPLWDTSGTRGGGLANFKSAHG